MASTEKLMLEVSALLATADSTLSPRQTQELSGALLDDRAAYGILLMLAAYEPAAFRRVVQPAADRLDEPARAIVRTLCALAARMAGNDTDAETLLNIAAMGLKHPLAQHADAVRFVVDLTGEQLRNAVLESAQSIADDN